MKKNKFIKVLLYIIITIYIASYMITNSDYYEYKLQEKTIIINEQIKQFEEDIKNNEDIDIKDYNIDKYNYQNKLTKFVYNISDNSKKISRKIVKSIFRRISTLVEEDSN